jgi:hypothetical protein
LGIWADTSFCCRRISSPAHDQFVAILPQTQDSVNVSLHATFAAIFDNFVPMIADELQIQH